MFHNLSHAFLGASISWLFSNSFIIILPGLKSYITLLHWLTMGGILGKGEKVESPKGWMPETKLDAKIKEAMQRRESEGSSMKSFNRIILKFPKIDESLRKCKAIFERFGGYLNHFPCN